MIRARDPIITSTPGGLRFESFSACCGVYARLDVPASGLDAEIVFRGVTNVDINDGLRQALAGLLSHEPLHLAVGDDALQVSTLDAQHVEEKVPLPSRWIRGLAEVQAVLAGMSERMSWDAIGTRRLVSGLPSSTSTHAQAWVTQAAGGARLASRPSTGAVALPGAERLRTLVPLLGIATGLRAFGADSGAGSPPLASGWVLDLPDARLTIAISPDKARGFSGEGGTLHALASDDVGDDASLVAGHLDFDERVDPDALAARLSIGPDRIRAALALLATSGQVGWDLDAGAYFHRPLPFDDDAMLTLNPRLADARELVDAGAVTWDGSSAALVDSAGLTYRVTVVDDGYACTCPWYAKHGAGRGPCKHVLAVRLART
jgi:hypothetical protein